MAPHRKAGRPQGHTAHFWNASQSSISLSGIWLLLWSCSGKGPWGAKRAHSRRPGFHDWAQNTDTMAATGVSKSAGEDAPCLGAWPLYTTAGSGSWLGSGLAGTTGTCLYKVKGPQFTYGF